VIADFPEHLNLINKCEKLKSKISHNEFDFGETEADKSSNQVRNKVFVFWFSLRILDEISYNIYQE
jgi:hypothetical protein